MGYLSDHFLNLDALTEYLTGISSPTPVNKALLLLLHCGNDKALAEEALHTSRTIDVIGSEDPDILTFIYHWGLVAVRQGQHNEIIACAKLARSLAADDSAASPLAFILAAEASNYAMMKDYSQFFASAHEALKVALKARTRIYMRVVANLATEFALLGCLSEIRKHLAQAQRGKVPYDVSYRLLVADLIDATEAFRIDEANRILGQLVPDNRSPKYPVDIAYFMQTMLHAYANMFPAQKPSPLHRAIPTERVSPDYPQEQEMLRVICNHLQNHRQQQALKTVYAMHKFHGEAFFVTPGMDAYFLIRAELANRNISAAYRALNLRDEAGLTHPVDSFFHARIALLQGGIKIANECFRECISAMDAINARNRLLFELALSCELPTPVLMEWTNLLRETPVRKEASTESVKGQNDAQPSASAHASTAIMTTRANRPVLTGAARLIGDSPDIRNVRQYIKRMAVHDAPILITGQTGTGKDVAAWAIHEESSRSPHPYVAINCAALGESLLSSELFGHERGAFTGASEKYQGLIRAAGKGTLLLDEIGEITPNMQAALLRVLETGEFRPVGSTRILTMQCRIIAATNRDLLHAVRDGRFRQDLFYRLRRLEINLTPLQMRKEDIPALTSFFFNWDRTDSAQVRLNPELMDVLMAHSWPGNVRELRNTVDRIRLFHGDKADYGLADLLDVMPEWTDRVPSANTAVAHNVPPAELNALTMENRSNSIPNRESERSPLRIEEAILHAFQKYQRMTRKELAREIKISPDTATKYLSQLITSGHIEKIMPSRSPRSHYFQLRK